MKALGTVSIQTVGGIWVGSPGHLGRTARVAKGIQSLARRTCRPHPADLRPCNARAIFLESRLHPIKLQDTLWRCH